MAGSITLTNLANYSLGIASDETAINVQKVNVKASGAKIMVKDKIGHEIGRVDHEIHQEYSIEGFVSGTTGVFADQIGLIITVANVMTLGGISAGACILDDVGVDYESGALAKVNYKATRYPDISASATQTNV